jgi:hypothetical protein
VEERHLLRCLLHRLAHRLYLLHVPRLDVAVVAVLLSASGCYDRVLGLLLGPSAGLYGIVKRSALAAGGS